MLPNKNLVEVCFLMTRYLYFAGRSKYVCITLNFAHWLLYNQMTMLSHRSVKFLNHWVTAEDLANLHTKQVPQFKYE